MAPPKRYNPKSGVPAWLRQPGESLREFEGFGIYSSLGPTLRTIAQVARIGRFPIQTLKLESVRWSWVERVKEWDAEIDRRVRERPAGEAIEMHNRQLAIARDLQHAAATELAAWINVCRAADAAHARLVEKRKKEGEEPPEPREPVIKPRDVLRMAHTGVVLERLVAGDSTARTEIKHAVDTSKLTRDELRQLDGLLGKMGATELDDEPLELNGNDATTH